MAHERCCRGNSKQIRFVVTPIWVADHKLLQSVNWLGGFVVVQFTKVGLDNLQWRFFLSKFRI